MQTLDGTATTAVLAVLLGAAAVLGCAGALGQRPARWHAVVCLAAQVGVVAYAAWAVTVWAGDGSPDSGVVFGLYLLLAVALLPAALLWARAEPTRWSVVIMAVACAATAVVVLRLGQVWAGV